MQQSENMNAAAPLAGNCFDGIKLNNDPPHPYLHGITHITIPQLYAGDDSANGNSSNPQDKTYLLFCSDMRNLHLNNFSVQPQIPETEEEHIISQTNYLAPCCQPHERSEPPEASSRSQHPGFILLSVKHEKIKDNQPHVRSHSGSVKSNAVPTRKISRRRQRKNTPNTVNQSAIVLDGVGFLSPEYASQLASNIGGQSNTLSRFRVTRIADASSWWIPNKTSMNISVHDLKTSSLPEFVTRQYQKFQCLNSGIASVQTPATVNLDTPTST